QQGADERELELAQTGIREVVDREVPPLDARAQSSVRTPEGGWPTLAFSQSRIRERGHGVAEVDTPRIVEVDRDHRIGATSLHLEGPEAIVSAHVEAARPVQSARKRDPADGSAGVVLARSD